LAFFAPYVIQYDPVQKMQYVHREAQELDFFYRSGSPAAQAESTTTNHYSSQGVDFIVAQI
jgi:hypothetical protein